MKNIKSYKEFSECETEHYPPPKYLIIPAVDDIMYKEIEKTLKDPEHTMSIQKLNPELFR